MVNTHDKIPALLSDRDPVIAKIITLIPPPQIKSTGDVFFDLMSCVLEQQIHYRSTKRIFQKMLAKASLEHLTPENFPVFEKKAFDGLKLSAQKYITILRILEFWANNNPHWATLSEAEVRKTLSTIPGIGPWTIDMILLYTLGHSDVFPPDDYHLKKGMIAAYGLDPNRHLKANMLEIAAQWKPHSSLAVLYLLDWKKAKITL